MGTGWKLRRAARVRWGAGASGADGAQPSRRRDSPEGGGVGAVTAPIPILLLGCFLGATACAHRPGAVGAAVLQEARASGNGPQAARGTSSTMEATTPAREWAAGADPGRLTESLLGRAEAALASGDPARAVALLAEPTAETVAGGGGERRILWLRAVWVLSEAFEAMRDCRGVVRTLERYLAAKPPPADAARALMRKGACEAELGRWEASRGSYRTARAIAGDRLSPDARVECFAREGYAAFEAGDLEGALAVLEAGAAAWRAMEDQVRLSSFYFVGMLHFYRGAVWHVRFRRVPIRSRKRDMAEDFEKKVRYLARAQEHYREAVRARHMFWVTAAGYQMGRLFAEFYDAVMYAPVPRWLSPRQRRIYFEELRKQLRPALEKAIWVFEKTVTTARRLGYASSFVDRASEKLAHLRAVVVAGQGRLGEPDPRLVPEVVEPVGPLAAEDAGRPALARKLHVPEPTPL